MHALSLTFGAVAAVTLAAGAALGAGAGEAVGARGKAAPVVRQDDCYGPGERNLGAEGFPPVDYKPCCDGQASVGRDWDWGMFCPGGGVGEDGVPYEPLLCGGGNLPYNVCNCKVGYPKCGWCMEDNGTPYRERNVCFCQDLPWGATPSGNECNPAKEYGPFRGSGLSYVPITCSSVAECGCKWGNGKPRCSWCPNDYGSLTQVQNVCWCTDFWWDANDVECNSLAANGPVKVDNVGGGNNNGGGNNDVPYNPIECSTAKQCGCEEWGAKAQCSWCPDDQGSPFKEKNVCWCDDAFGNGSGARECNPSKPKGPFKIDVDGQVFVFSYDPIVCEPNQSQCNCEFGTATCGLCPFDKGSRWQGYNVCWCNYEGYTKEGFYPHANNPSGECNPQKYLGPSFNWN